MLFSLIKFIKTSKDAQKSAQAERIKAIMAARSQQQQQQQHHQQQQQQQHHQQQQQQHDSFFPVQLPFQQHPSLPSTHEKFTPPPPSLNSTPTSSFSSLLQDVRLNTNDFNDVDEFDSLINEPVQLHYTSTPKVSSPVTMECFQELQKELCLLKTQVEILHDDVRHLKRKVNKVNYIFLWCKTKGVESKLHLS